MVFIKHGKLIYNANTLQRIEREDDGSAQVVFADGSFGLDKAQTSHLMDRLFEQNLAYRAAHLIELPERARDDLDDFIEANGGHG